MPGDGIGLIGKSIYPKPLLVANNSPLTRQTDVAD
jgi:hypothetical protein